MQPPASEGMRSAAACPILVENQFGPVVNGCANDFDFTLLFEETYFSLVLSAICIPAIVARLHFLRDQGVKVRANWTAIAKLIAHATHVLLQVSLVALWGLPSTPRTDTTLAAASLATVAGIGLGFLSYLEHLRSIRPSDTLILYFLFSLVLDIPRARTLFLIDGLGAIPVVFVVCMGSRVALLALETMEKRNFICPDFVEVSPEPCAGIANRALFGWLNTFLWMGARRTLTMGDLFPVERKMASSSPDRHRLRPMGASHGSSSLLLLLIKMYRWELLAGLIPRLAQVGFTFAQPYLLRRAVILFASPHTPNAHDRGIALTAAYAIVYVGIAISTAQAQHSSCRFLAMIRGTLLSMIYKKALMLRSRSQDVDSAMAAIGVDLERISAELQCVHDTWGSLIEVGLCLWLLYYQLWAADAVPILISLGCVMLGMVLSVSMRRRQTQWLDATKRRLTVTADMIGAMKVIKMSGLVDVIWAKVCGLRASEISSSRQFRSVLIAVTCLANVNRLLTPVISLTAYMFISRHANIGTLNSERAFTSLAFLELFAASFLQFIQALTAVATAIGCIDRLEKYLSQEEKGDYRNPPLTRFAWDEDKINCKQDDCSIEAQEVSIGWREGESTILHNMSFNMQPVTLTMIYGPVGCGKTTLLNALLGETQNITGSLKVNASRIAYCSQTAWLVNGTIRQNIVGQAYFDLEWYQIVLRACDLVKDLQELPHGDRTLIGSKGISLSGGQKQRLALARAVYSQIELLILDDIMSCLDPATEDHIFSRLLGSEGLLKNRGVTVVMVTNLRHQLLFADQIIALTSDGTILAQGTFSKVHNQLSDTADASALGETPNQSWTQKASSTKMPGLDSKFYTHNQSIADSPAKGMAVLKYYFDSAPWFAWVAFYCSLAVVVSMNTLMSVWVKWWAEDNDTEPNQNLAFRAVFYWLLGILTMSFFFGCLWTLLHGILQKVMMTLHRKLLRTVIDAPLAFFTSTDSGRVYNFFSQDLELIDSELPIVLLLASLALFMCLAQLVVISINVKYVTAVLPAFLLVFGSLRAFYSRTTRQLRIMDIESRSPLFSNLMETMDGLSTIRAFGWQDEYREINHRHTSESQKPFYLLLVSQRWLNVVLDLTLAGLVITLMGIGVATIGKISPSSIGLALVNLISLSSSMKMLITYWTGLETSLGAVARVKHFVEGTRSEHLPRENRVIPSEWAEHGSIQFNNVCAYYKDPSEPAVKNVSFSIQKGEKIAICGRTGSGKSSLVSALFRLVELSEGSILIDGVDLSTVARRQVRSALFALPQEPYLLQQSSVRENLDPLDQNSDDAAIQALDRVGLWSTIKNHGGLDTICSDDTFSHGQKQLLCIARTMLRGGNIVIFDECTSHVDTKTSDLIQDIIRSHFRKHSVIAITHRLKTILDFDRVLVMQNGNLIESGPPMELLARPSAFNNLFHRSEGQDMDEN